jgi:hypothetical protein
MYFKLVSETSFNKNGGLILVEPTFFYPELLSNVNDKPNSLKNTNLIKKISKKQIITLRSNASFRDYTPQSWGGYKRGILVLEKFF